MLFCALFVVGDIPKVAEFFPVYTSTAFRKNMTLTVRLVFNIIFYAKSIELYILGFERYRLKSSLV